MPSKTRGVIRHILTFAGGIAVANGWIDEGNLTEIIGSAMTLIGFIWSLSATEKKS